MHLPLKFVTDIIRPWEKLNLELINQNSIDKDISDIITIAGDLAVKISHFPETANKKSVRTIKSSEDFNIIVDIADSWKHNDSPDENRNSKLSISSLFEGNDEGTFRFIRNKIVVKHNKYGINDFLEVSKKAAQFLFFQLNLSLHWNPSILEAPYLFSKTVFLNIFYTHQIAWNGLSIEFVKKNNKGQLVHYDPPKWQFELRSPLVINTKDYHSYIIQLIKNSISNENTVDINVSLKLSDTNSDNFFIADMIFNDFDSENEKTIVKILDKKELTLTNLNDFQNVLSIIKATRLFLVSQIEFPKEIKEAVSNSITNIYLITLEKLEAENVPIGFFKNTYKHSNLIVTSVTKSVMGVLAADQHLFSTLKGKPAGELGEVFSFDKINLMSFQTLCLSQVKRKKDKLNGTTTINCKPRDKRNIFIKIHDEFIKIGLEVVFEWEQEIKELHMPILSFEKHKQGISIWNLETFNNSSKGIIHLKIPVTKYGDTSAIGMI